MVAIFGGVLYQRAGLRRDAHRFPAPGKSIDIGGSMLHADIAGEGNPPVVFEAGIAATSLSWRLIQSEIAKTTQTVSYDRAGLGWSNTNVNPRDLWHLVDELRAMLDSARISKPRVLVAHSFGGLIALAYASRYPQDLAGMVLVDPVGAEEWADPSPHARAMLARGIFLSRCGAALANIGLVRLALNLLASGTTRAPKIIARASSGRGGAAFTERMVGQIQKLPQEVWPMIQSHWCDPKCFRSMAQQLAMLPECSAVILDAKQIRTPFILLSAGDANPVQRESHTLLVEKSLQAKLEIVNNSGHWIQLDRPDVVIAAIREMISLSNPS